jgi:hypothetical protein
MSKKKNFLILYGHNNHAAINSMKLLVDQSNHNLSKILQINNYAYTMC